MHRTASSASDQHATSPAAAAGDWLHVEAPDAHELQLLRSLGIPDVMLEHASDLDERPRVYREGELLMLVLNYPRRLSETGGIPYETSPISVFVAGQRIITVAPQSAEFVGPLLQGKVRELSVEDPTGFILRLMWQLADEFLVCVREINASVDQLEVRLRKSLRNEEVMGLLDCQKSLTYFTTAMRSNELVLERLRTLEVLDWTDADRDLLEDLQIEMRQAIEMVDISDNILSQTMDAFTSIVSNNLGAVMKVLTSVTILLAVPTLIASLYGMNVLLPGERSPLAFTGLLLLSVVLCVVLFVMFRRRNWL